MQEVVIMTVKVIVYPGKKTEAEFKEAVERYVRSWIFDREGYEYEEEKKDKCKASSNSSTGNDVSSDSDVHTTIERNC